MPFHPKLAALAAIAAAGLIGAPAALADTPISMCVPSAGGQTIKTPTAGTCAAGSALRQTADQADLTAAKSRITQLETLLAGVTRGTVNGKNTITFSAQNVRIVNGQNSTSWKNGLGNLIIGYNETPGSQSGSHNLILGREQTATGWGSVLGGSGNNSNGASQALFGRKNAAKEGNSTVLGGYGNIASDPYTSVLGGCANYAGAIGGTKPADPIIIDCQGFDSGIQTIAGGLWGEATGTATSIGGGYHNKATGNQAVVAAGNSSTASGGGSAVTGGYINTASGYNSAVSGGEYNNASGYVTTVSGGEYNEASNNVASVHGGSSGEASGWASSVTGGYQNNATGFYTSVTGGQYNSAGGTASHVSGGTNNSAASNYAAILGGNGTLFLSGTANYRTYPAGP